MYYQAELIARERQKELLREAEDARLMRLVRALPRAHRPNPRMIARQHRELR